MRSSCRFLRPLLWSRTRSRASVAHSGGHPMSDISKVKVLAFDVFGTTVDWCSGVAREAERILKPKGFDLDWTEFAVRWRKEYQPAMEEVRKGDRGYVTLDTLHNEMLEPVLFEYRIEDLSDAE